MKTAKVKAILLSGGVALIAGGIYAINHITDIAGQQSSTIQFLFGWVIGGFPLIIGVNLAVMTLVAMWMERSKQDEKSI